MTDIKDTELEAAYEANRELGNTPQGRKILSNKDLGAKILDKYESSLRDPLTGAYNRGFFDSEMRSLLQENKDFALIIVDIDLFKKVNDHYGHNTGDAVLKRTALELSSGVKTARPEGEEDLVARFGGEEFGIILRGVNDVKIAEAVAERVRRNIETTTFPAHDGRKMKITISVGTTLSRDGDDLLSLTERADQALYEAKRGGRNQAVSK